MTPEDRKTIGDAFWGACQMGTLLGVLLYLFCWAFDMRFGHAGGHARPTPTPSSVSLPSPPPAPPGGNAVLATLGADLGPSVDLAFARRAISLLNDASPCMKARGNAWSDFTSFNTVFDVSPKTAASAIDTYFAGAPYALDLRWYYKRFSKVIGYTYNFKDNDWNAGSETRIWSNTKFIGADPKPYAAHLAHELSHQGRAGGYVHYSVFQGSFPYEIGDIAAACLGAL